ncbi:unannotated protein [freshwater metagenome]|uniref:Unannotated protein n=1 Tax=freshwater metagenome TaxID=449393 RepID=A0A6J7SD46_9ZZZZ
MAATVHLLDTTPAVNLQIEPVIKAAGASVSSLYHFFADFRELVETAQVVRFSRFVDVNVGLLTTIVNKSRTPQELRAGLSQVTRSSHTPEMRHLRMDRIEAINATAGNPRMTEALGAEQLRLTRALAELVGTLQTRGWMRPDLDPMAASVLIQAYTLGTVVNDVSPEQMDPEHYYVMIDLLVEHVFGLSQAPWDPPPKA